MPVCANADGITLNQVVCRSRSEDRDTGIVIANHVSSSNCRSADLNTRGCFHTDSVAIMRIPNRYVASLVRSDVVALDDDWTRRRVDEHIAVTIGRDDVSRAGHCATDEIVLPVPGTDTDATITQCNSARNVRADVVSLNHIVGMDCYCSFVFIAGDNVPCRGRCASQNATRLDRNPNSISDGVCAGVIRANQVSLCHSAGEDVGTVLRVP